MGLVRDLRTAMCRLAFVPMQAIISEPHFYPMKRIAALAIALMFTLLSRVVAGETSLLDLPVKDYHVGFGDLWISKCLDHRQVLLHGKPCEEYIFAHAASWILYDIPAGVTSFSAWGIRPSGDDNIVGSWFYIVKVDGKELFRSKPLASYPDLEVQIQVAIPPGSKQIELIIDPMKNQFADHSIWAVPVFK